MIDPFDISIKKDLKGQEHLSLKFLKQMKNGSNHLSFPNRPSQSLVQLMHWAKYMFQKPLLGNLAEADSIDTNIQINNKIIIDGAFLAFCNEKNVKIKCLSRDSIASWQDESVESFVAQGVFLIEHNDLKFIHAGLFHKGNQNEDEVSFFIIVRDRLLHKYIEFRNQYEEWTLSRERSNLEVTVVGGDDIPYTRDSTWDSVFLPDDLKNRIRNNIEGFLKSEEVYKKARIPWKRGMLLYGEAGCGKTSLIRIMMSCYNLKPVTININGHSSADDMIEQAFNYAELHAPSLLFLEDINILLTEKMNVSHFLQLMDGISSKSGLLVIGTANDISGLESNITDRPSRFSNKFEIPLPNKKMAAKYLESWFKNIIKDKNIYKEIAESAVRHKFSYAYLEEIYISSAFLAIHDGRDNANVEDIKQALKLLIDDKKDVKSDFKSKSIGEIGIHAYEKDYE